jgi:hypothetical protein
MNMTNPLLLETHRGKPFVLINDRVAREKGIDDDSLVRVWNEVGEFVVPARTSPAQRPNGLTVYNGFEGFMFQGGKGANEVEPGMVKWLHLAGDYGHLSYAPTEWRPRRIAASTSTAGLRGRGGSRFLASNGVGEGIRIMRSWQESASASSGKHLETGLRPWARRPSRQLEDAGIRAADLDAAYVSNAMAGLITGRECIRSG